MPIRFLSPWFKHKKTQHRPQIFEGITKTLFSDEESGNYILHFKDVIESQDSSVHPFPGKGAIANKFSELMMQRLEDAQVQTHFIKRLNMSEQFIRPATPFPFTVSVHNIATGTFASRLGIEDLSTLSRPVVEFNVKLRHNEGKTIAGIHIDALNWAHQHEIDYLYFIISRMNDFLMGQFQALGLKLLNFTVEFGRHYKSGTYEDGIILLTDELSPECFTVQDIATDKVLSLFAKNETGYMLNLENYLNIAKRFGVIPAMSNFSASPETLIFPSKT